MKKILYYILNLTFHTLDREIIKYLKKDKKLIIFDVGCYRGIFFQRILRQVKGAKKNTKFYIFDINKNVKKYIHRFLKLKNFFYNEVALSNNNGKAKYNYNSFFESSGSSLSNLYRNDKMWVLSRKFFLKIFFQSTNNYTSYEVPTITLDFFIKKKKIKFISVLKIDVDGSEKQVLNGAKKNLKKNKIKIILIEINDKKNHYIKKEKQIINFLKRYNFELVKKRIMFSPSFLSNMRSGDYLLINNNFNN